MDQKLIEELLADKLALDQLYGECIRSLHDARKQLIMREGEIKKLLQQVEDAKSKEKSKEFTESISS
jgi:hypothetical protein